MSTLDDQINNDISTLETLNTELSKQKEKPKDNPMDNVEKSLSNFVNDAFEMTKSEFDFQKQIQEHILSRIDTFSENQLIALVSNTGVNSADKIAKTMNPWVQLATARQQAQIAAESAERTAAIQTGQSPTIVNGNTIKEINQTASKEVLQGIDSLSKFIEIAVTAAKKLQIEEPLEKPIVADEQK